MLTMIGQFRLKKERDGNVFYIVGESEIPMVYGLKGEIDGREVRISRHSEYGSSTILEVKVKEGVVTKRVLETPGLYIISITSNYQLLLTMEPL